MILVTVKQGFCAIVKGRHDNNPTSYICVQTKCAFESSDRLKICTRSNTERSDRLRIQAQILRAPILKNARLYIKRLDCLSIQTLILKVPII